MPDDVEDEDLIDELPPLGDLREDEDGFSPAELGVGFGDGGTDDVGLDDSVGVGDVASLFELELPPTEADDDAGVDAIPIADIDGGEDEYGWTEDAGSAADERWDPSDLDMPSMTPLGRDDGGEEGIEEVFDLGGGGDDAVPNLPPLEGDDEADDEEGMELALTLDERFADLPPELDGVSVELVRQGPVYDAVIADRVWALGDVLTVDGVPRSPAPWGARPISLHVDGDLALVGTEDGAYRSEHDGQSFARIEGLDGAIRFAGEVAGPIWACCGAARLQKSDDRGATWSPTLLLTTVVALDVPALGVVALCVPEAASPQLARSTDGGQRWAALDGPVLHRAPEGRTTFSVAAADEHVVVVASDADPGGPFLSRDGGRSWLRVPALPPACALAVRREEALAIYSAHTAAGRSAVVRHPPDGGEAGVVFECAGRIHRLILGERDEIWVASDDGLHRVRREPEE